MNRSLLTAMTICLASLAFSKSAIAQPTIGEAWDAHNKASEWYSDLGHIGNGYFATQVTRGNAVKTRVAALRTSVNALWGTVCDPTRTNNQVFFDRQMASVDRMLSDAGSSLSDAANDNADTNLGAARALYLDGISRFNVLDLVGAISKYNSSVTYAEKVGKTMAKLYDASQGFTHAESTLTDMENIIRGMIANCNQQPNPGPNPNPNPNPNPGPAPVPVPDPGPDGTFGSGDDGSGSDIDDEDESYDEESYYENTYYDESYVYEDDSYYDGY